MSQHLHVCAPRCPARGCGVGGVRSAEQGRGAREARRETAGEREAKQEEQPAAGRALAAPHAALPPPNRFKKIHQLHDRAPLKGARRHLVRVNSGRLRERAGWVRVTLWEAAGVGPCARRPNKEARPPPVSRSGRRGRPRGRGPGGPRLWPGRRGGRARVGRSGPKGGCRPRRRSVARRQGGPLAGLGRARGLSRGGGPAAAAVAGKWGEMGLGAPPTHLG